jgi:hypothetical protein
VNPTPAPFADPYRVPVHPVAFPSLTVSRVGATLWVRRCSVNHEFWGESVVWVELFLHLLRWLDFQRKKCKFQ